MKSLFKHANNKIKDHFVSAAFLAPSLIGVLIFFVIPFAVVIFYSLVNNPVAKEFVGLDNFIAVIRNQAFQTAAKNTAIFSGIAVPLAVILGLFLALLLDSKIPFRSQFRTLFLCPMMVPVASIVLIWRVFFDQSGVVNQLLANFGIEQIDWLKSEYSRYVIIFLFLWKNLGYNMILFMAALNNIPRPILEMSTVEGASPFQQFRYIKLPYLVSSIVFVTILSLINSFKVFREVYLLTGDYPYGDLYLLQHFMNNMFRSLDYQKLSTAAILMCIVVVILVGIMLFVDNKAGKDIEG